MVAFVCPHCEAPVDPRDPFVAARSRCKQCGEPISLPAQLSGRMAAAHADFLDYDAEAEDRPEIRARVVRDLGVENLGENLTGLHYLYGQLIADYVARAAQDPEALLLAIEACQQQISIAPRVAQDLLASNPALPLPPHAGFEQLCLIRERQRRYEWTVALAEEAQAAGWAGPWERIVARCKKTTIQRKPKP